MSIFKCCVQKFPQDRMMHSGIIFFVCLVIIHAYNTAYEGYKVFKIIPQFGHEVEFLKNITRKLNADVWTGSKISLLPWVLSLGPNQADTFHNFLSERNIEYDVISNNLGDTISKEFVSSKGNPEGGSINLRITRRFNKLRSHRSIGDFNITMDMDEYYNYEEIRSYMDRISQLFPSKVQLFTLGTTKEGRSIEGVKLSNGDGERKAAILIEAGTHAREWITPALAVYIMNQLTENENYMSMLEKVDWYIFPVLNPDGYWYSIMKDRMWRKNRKKNNNCYGVDLNRNFNFHWNESESDECQDDFPGPQPSSEPEIDSFSRFVWQHRDDIKLYLSLHSYGGFIIYPWAWTTDNIHSETEHHDLGLRAAKAVKSVRGTEYFVGSAGKTLYTASGTSQDWMFGTGGVPFSFTIEVAAYGSGFDPPSHMIKPIVEETFEGIRVFHDHVESTWGY